MSEIKVIVVGAVGSGKSGLIAHLVADLAAKGIEVAWDEGASERNLRGADLMMDIFRKNPRVVFTETNARLGGQFQDGVRDWVVECFGAEIAGDIQERNSRFLEEALELVQSKGCTQEEAHQLVDYVFGRPAGEPSQEVGGVMVTLAALCCAAGIDLQQAADKELNRVNVPELMERIRLKQLSKPATGPLPGIYPERKRVDLTNLKPVSGVIDTGFEMPMPVLDAEAFLAAAGDKSKVAMVMEVATDQTPPKAPESRIKDLTHYEYQERLMHAMNPFAKAAEVYKDTDIATISDNVELWQLPRHIDKTGLTVGDLRRAADLFFSRPDPSLCEDEGCPWHGSAHVCTSSKSEEERICTDRMISAGFEELDKRGFRVGASDLGMDDLKAVFLAMQEAQ